ncbi:hypothetical protein NW768_010055 [Fusarium equiseti]|uniref:Uncharacterized protein n=1 Tax=Fusarium equiseti TaxID=61235 RepID=A0ABQ8R1D9_FUSEQ|nr:hypothetical protein NW768_010055 [Fusarium equiseti]
MEDSTADISATTILPRANGLEAPTSRSGSGHDLTATGTTHLASSIPQPMSTQDVQPLTEREAFLFTTYVHKLAPLSDACDDARHFTLQVPHLALQNPMILYGILALSSRYDSPTTLESTYYHNKHINLLIQAFDLPWDTTLLTSVVLARLYEENDPSSDPHTHLSGTQNLLNHEVISRFVMEGGLAEAASWVHLRQTIYVYVARKLPVEICLENFERSGVFQRRDDSAWANRAVFLFARIMKMLLGKREWGQVEGEIEKWFEERPVSFKPIFYKKGDVLEDTPFPVICFAASVPGKALFDVSWVVANVV